LNFVVLFGEEFSARMQAGDERANVVFVDEHADFRQIIRRAGADRRHRASARQSAVDHESRQFFDTHAAHQVGCSDVRRQSPILVGIKFPVFVQVLKRESIDRKQRRRPMTEDGLRW
jgi:hypothetical protein